jgi:hypothetical protein
VQKLVDDHFAPGDCLLPEKVDVKGLDEAVYNYTVIVGWAL